MPVVVCHRNACWSLLESGSRTKEIARNSSVIMRVESTSLCFITGLLLSTSLLSCNFFVNGDIRSLTRFDFEYSGSSALLNFFLLLLMIAVD